MASCYQCCLQYISKFCVFAPSLSGILTQEECFAISVNLINPCSLPVMPLHLSSCRNQRSALLSRLENAEQPTISGGIYCLRNFENESLIVKEPFLNNIFPFVVNRPVIFKGDVFAGMILAEHEIILSYNIIFINNPYWLFSQQVFNEQGIAFYCH